MESSSSHDSQGQTNNTTLSNWKNNLLCLVLTTWILIFYLGSDIEDLPRSRSANPPPMHLYYEDLHAKREEQLVSASPPVKLVKQELEDPATYKKILLFTPFFNLQDWGFGGFGHEPFVNANCPVTNCYLTNNQTSEQSIGSFDAVIFHMRNMEKGRIAIPNQAKRRPEQRYVMFIVESPIHDDFPYHRFKGKLHTISEN